MLWEEDILAVYISRLNVMVEDIVAVYISCLKTFWLSTYLGMMVWVGDIVAVYISRLDVMGRCHCGCLHF